MTIVSVAGGELRGAVDGGIHAFKGIPYAEPLGGRARWLPPRPRRAWRGVRDATRYGDACMQFPGLAFPLSFPGARARYFEALEPMRSSREGDDCLLLNVWSPTLDRGARLPVMVWIHGGGFTKGVANEVYDSAHIAREGVVAVVIQYRLGPPGFLHGSGLFDGELCADNRAFLDQVLALRWVQENIAAFGGDPANVTLFGESAGAFAVYQLAASPLAKGLFRRCIAMGGTPDTCAPADEYRQLTRDVLEGAGVKAGDARALLALDRERLQALQRAISGTLFRARDPGRYGSLGRNKLAFMGAATGTSFLPAAPLSSYPNGTPNDVDLVLGNCANDGGLFSLMLPLGRAASARRFSKYLEGVVPGGDMAALRRHYGERMPDAGRARLYDQINHDAFYRAPTLRAAEAHAAARPGKTWHYQLECKSAVPGLDGIHAIDVALLFPGGPIRELVNDDEETRRVSGMVLDAWTSFARTGTPRAPGLPDWQPFGAERSTMVIDQPARLERNLDAHLLGYWQ